ncbi:MAG: triose-phosphate isomerase [Clostridiales bacterium]|nr:triose-phosphate isomerase [Clostridiales bacterium]
MKKLIYGNLKMNFNLKDMENYCELFLKKVEQSKNEIAIFPSFTNLMFTKQKLTASKVLLGAQNLSSEVSGAYTGEISADMLKSVGAELVIVGHSERRKLFLEKNETINKKIKQALSQGLKVVLCVGETKYERQNRKYKMALEKIISETLKGLYENELKNIIIAYEPIWAIGTGVLPTVKEIEEAANIIRNQVSVEFTSQAAKNLKLLYGGSVNTQNCKQFLGANGINGLLVGGASLKADEFAKICNS